MSFTLVRILSGAIILSPIFIFGIKKNNFSIGFKTILPPLMLFGYALFFSLAYVNIDAGTGALILFACVQLTMMIYSILLGQKMTSQEIVGFGLALLGFIYLLLPGVEMPPPFAASLMAISGLSWGIYSLIGQHQSDPKFATASNFVLLIPLSVALLIIFPIKLSFMGWIYGLLSGAVTSGLGYVLWYIVVKKLETSTAAIVQLSVPALAALGGVIFLQESIQTRLIVASLFIFLGIYIKVIRKSQKSA
jgi:drug/metabolite transporter (DMT)-like permease